MSDPGRTEAAKKQPKKNRRNEGDVSSKPVVGYSPHLKKGKKKTEAAQEEAPESEQKQQPPEKSQEVAKDTEKEIEKPAVSNSKEAELVSPPSPKPPLKVEAVEKLPEENGDNGKIEEIKEEKPEKVEEVSDVEKIRVSSPAKTVLPKVCLDRLSEDMSHVRLAFDEYGVPLIVYRKHNFYRGTYHPEYRAHEYKCVQRLCEAKLYLGRKSFKVVKEVNRHDHEPPPESEAQSNIKKECLYKILVIGELGTGKTSIIKRYVHQFFSQHYRATIGVDFALKVLNWDQNTIIRLQLWDIAGQERFGNMTRVYYKEAVGAFIVFDVTRAATFDAVVKWKQDLDAKVQLADGSPIPCVLLANKCDQQKEGLVNNPNKMNEYCEEHKFSAWFETSAKENINIEEAAKSLVDLIVRNDSSNENGRDGLRDTSKFPLESTEEFSDGKSCAC